MFGWKARLLLLLPLLAASATQAQVWTPADLPVGELKNWYDAADTNTLWQDAAATIPVTANSQTVLCWTDKSGNGNHLTSTNGPAYTNAAMNSLPVLLFADDTFCSSLPNMGKMSDNFTVIGVFKSTKNDSYDNWVRWGNGDKGGGDLAVLEDSAARTGGANGSMEFHYDTGIGSYTTNSVLNQAFIFCGFVNQVGYSQFTVWENGLLQQTLAPALKTTPCTNLTFFQIGYTNVPSNRNPNGNLAEMLILNTGTNTLADADRQKIEGYLANKWWGGTNNPLPDNHPYKNGPPCVAYTITATNSIGGLISPSGVVREVAGQDQTFTITPDNAYGILDVAVDGVSKGALRTYTFTNVQSDHTIVANFAPLVPVVPISLVATPGEETVKLSWSASQYALGYKVQRATVSGGPYTAVAGTTDNSYTDGMVVKGTEYYYVVSATNSLRESAISAEVCATPELSPGLWKPSALGTAILKNWYDAADFSTLWQDAGATTQVSGNGQTVLVWNDKSGNGNRLSSVNGPAYTASGLNSLPVLTFADSSFSNGAPNMGSMTDNFTLFGVFQSTANDYWDNWLRWGNGNQGGADISLYLDRTTRSGGSVGSMELSFSGGTGAYTTNSVVSQPAFIFAGAVNQANNPSNLFTVWENGVSQGTMAPTIATAPSSSLACFQVGYGSISTRNPNGYIAEMLIVNTGTNSLAEADRQRIEGYLANKWWGRGADNPLPNSHPYKNIAPGALSYITYNGNGNTGGLAPVDINSPYAAGTGITVLGSGSLNRRGYVFTNWNTIADGTGVGYDPGDALPVAPSTILYAQWTPVSPVPVLAGAQYLGKLDPFYRYGRVAVNGGTLWGRLLTATNSSTWLYGIPDYVLDTSFPYQKSTNTMEIPFCKGVTMVRPLSSATSTNNVAKYDLVYRDNQGNLVYQWNLLQQELQPFMNLNIPDVTFVMDAMPAAFASSPAYATFGQITPPDSFVDWKAFVEAAVSNIVAITGTNFASHFRFRMGTEYDNATRFAGTIDQFNQYWDACCVAIHKVLPNAPVGPYNMTGYADPFRDSSLTEESYYTLANYNLQANYPLYPFGWYCWTGYIAPSYDPSFMPNCLKTKWDAFESAFPAYQNLSREVHEFDFLATSAPTPDYSGGIGAEGAGMLFQTVMKLRACGTRRIYGSEYPEIIRDRSGNPMNIYSSISWVYTLLDNLLGDDAYLFPVTTSSGNGTHYLALGTFRSGRAVLVVSAHNSDLSNNIPESIQVTLPTAFFPAGAGQPWQVSLSRTNSVYERIRDELAKAGALSPNYVQNPLWVGPLFTVTGNPNLFIDSTNQYIITDNWSIYTNLWKSSLTLAPVPASWSLTSQTNNLSTLIGLTIGHPEIRVMVWQTSPTLQVQLSHGGVMVSWPAWASGYRLQVSHDLSNSSAWTDVPVGTTNNVWLPLNANSSFYRLIQ